MRTIQNRKIVAATLALVLAVCIVVVLLHYLSKNEVVTRFQEQQLLHAHHVAEQVETFFRGHAMVLRSFSTPISQQHETMDQLRMDLNAYSQEMGKEVVGVSLDDASGRTVYSTDGNTAPDAELLSWCRNPENRHSVFVRPVIKGAQDPERTSTARMKRFQTLKFLLAIPLYQKTIKGEERFMGLISLTVELKPFLKEELNDSPMTLRDAWIIEQDGTVLFHSEHPEMAFRNIYHNNGECTRCHRSFDYVRKILEKKEGTLSFETDASVKKLAGFAAMRFQNASWIVVVDAEDKRVTSFIRTSLLSHLALFGITILSAAGGFVLIRRSYQAKIRADEEARHLQETVIERKKAEEVLKASEERLRFVSSQVLSAQEQERRRISRELHDEVGPALAILKMRVRRIKERTPEDQVEIREECTETLEYLDLTIDNIRRFSRDLSPAVLEHLGLTAALRRLLADFSEQHHDIQVSLDLSDDMDRLFSRDARIMIYRIFQEVTHNIAKHAAATRVSVTVVHDHSGVAFTIEDNGKGFDKNGVELRDSQRRGMGLDILYERVRMLGGVLDLSTQEGKGTRIVFRVPPSKREDV